MTRVRVGLQNNLLSRNVKDGSVITRRYRRRGKPGRPHAEFVNARSAYVTSNTNIVTCYRYYCRCCCRRSRSFVRLTPTTVLVPLPRDNGLQTEPVESAVDGHSVPA